MFESLRKSQSSKIQNRLVRYYIIFAVLTVILVTSLTYIQAARSLRLMVEDKLNTVAELKQDNLNRWVDEQQSTANFLASLPSLRSYVGRILDADASQQDRASAKEGLIQLITLIAQRTADYRDIQVLDLNGKIVVSVAPGNIGVSQANQPFFEIGQEKTFVQDFYESDLFGSTTLTVATPLFDTENKRVAVLALHFNMKRVDDIVRGNRNLNESIQGYLINSNRRMITNDPILLAESPAPRSIAIDAALNGEDGNASYLSHTNTPVIGKYQWIKELNAALIVEIDEQSALAPARSLAFNVALIGILFSLGLVIIVIFLARRITAPLLALTRTVSHITAGDLNASAPVLSEDEVGTLAQAFNTMTAKLRQTMAGLETELHERKQAEERYRTLFEGMQDGVYRSTHDGRFIDVNPAMVKMFGYEDREELLSVDIANDLYFSPEERESQYPEIDNEKVDIFRMRRKDGSEIWVEDRGRFVRDPDGNVIYHEGLLRDITERIQAENALRDSEQKFRTIFESSPIAICITTLEDGRMLEANYAYWNLMGLDPEISVGKTAGELKLWDSPEERDVFVQKLKQKASLYNPDDEFVDENGKTIHAISFYRMVNIGGEERVISMFYDMSAQKQTMQALQESEARVRALLEAIPDMILELSKEGMVINVIPPKGMEDPMPASQFVGKQIHEVLSETAAKQTIFAIQRSLETSHIGMFEFEEKLGNNIRAMEARVVPNSLDTVIMMIRDITQRKWADTEREKLISELEVRSKESETLRDSLASVVGTFEFSEIIQRILDKIQLVVPYDSASIWRLEGTRQILIGERGLPGELPENLQFEIDSHNHAAQLFRGELPYMTCHDVQANPAFSRFHEPPHNHINSWLGVPLKTRGQIIGLIALDGYQKDQFKEHHARLAVTFADQVAIALENARLYSDLQAELSARQILIRELEEKNAEAETMRESTSIVAATLDISDTIQRIFEQIKRVVQYDSASVWLYQDDYAYMMGSIGLPPGAELPGKYLRSENEPDYAFLKEKVPYILFDDVQDHYSSFRLAPKNYIHGWLTIPLRVRGNLTGFISLDSRTSGKFTEHDAELALTFADQVSIAIENARLFSDLQAELAARKDLIAELESKNSELERFTYTVSHDLKSPLFTIRGFLGYLEQDALAGNHERVRSDMQRITDATNKMQQLLNELLELSRIGRLMNEPASIPFGDLARDAVELVHGRIVERGITVRIDDDMPVIVGDRQRLLEVVQNLVDNAAKFMGNQTDPRIEIGQAGEESGKPIFFVRDNGMGIPPEHHERIFGLFNKLDVKSDGTGIGLALVKRIVEVHGGRIWVQSDSGSGATFYFTLPTSPNPKPVDK